MLSVKPDLPGFRPMFDRAAVKYCVIVLVQDTVYDFPAAASLSDNDDGRQ